MLLMLIVPVGSVNPLDPEATDTLVKGLDVVLGPTKKVPLVGNPVVEPTLMVPVGKATLLDPEAIVVAFPCCNDEIKKIPEFLNGYNGLLNTSILPTSDGITPRTPTGIEISIAAPLLAIPALLFPGKVGATVGVVSPVANKYCPTPLMLKLVSPT
jgi:hypothetical protein